MRSSQFPDGVGLSFSPDLDQPFLPDSPCIAALDDDERQQRDFVEDLYRDLGVGD